MITFSDTEDHFCVVVQKAEYFFLGRPLLGYGFMIGF